MLRSRIIKFILVFSFTGLVSAAAWAQADNDGTFDALSPGNQKVANALFDAQPKTAEGVPVDGSLTRDDIAARKGDGTGWGKLFQDMQADGQIPDDVKNLGQLVSGRHQSSTVGTTTAGKSNSAATTSKPARVRSKTIITTAGGRQITIERKPSGNAASGTKTVGGKKHGVITADSANNQRGSRNKGSGITNAGNGSAYRGGKSKVQMTTAGGSSVNAGGSAGQALGNAKAGNGKALGKGKVK